MVQRDARKLVEDTQRLLVILWPAFVSTVIICLFIPQFITRDQLSYNGNSIHDPLRIPLWIVVFMVIVILWWWIKRFLIKEAILKRVLTGQVDGSKVLIKGVKSAVECVQMNCCRDP